MLRFRRTVDLTVLRGACKTETQGWQHSLNVVGAARHGQVWYVGLGRKGLSRLMGEWTEQTPQA